MINRFLFLVFNLSSLIFILLTCQKDPTSLDNAQLELKAEYVEVTEAWLRLSTDTISKNSTYVVKRDTHIVFEGILQKPDTLLHDENLEPLHTYTYTAYRTIDNRPCSKKQVTITTMDTTSHNFSCQVFEFGTKSSSYFCDVAIISPTDIYAVGQIYTEDSYTYDSLGNWIDRYNAAHWDGEKWELKHIPFKLCGGSGCTIYPRIDAVYLFDSNTGVFVCGGSISKKDGSKFYKDCNMNAQLKGAMEHIWGISENEYYITGSKSAIGTDNIFLKYKDGNWDHLEVPSDVDINDVWGAIDEETGETYILAPLSFKFNLGDKKLIRLKPDNSIIEENWPFPNRLLNSVWFKDKHRVFVCGGGVFSRNKFKQWKEYKELPSIFTDKIRGNDINDIFIAGDFGILAHFNGKTWKQYTEFNEVDIFHSLAFKDDTAVAVGEKNRKAVVYMIRR